MLTNPIRARRIFPVLLGVSALALALSLGSGPLSAQEAGESTNPPADEGKPMTTAEMSPEEVNAISHGLTGQFMSPYCPGKTLRDCTSGKAAVLRDEIHEWVEQGRSRQWIENELVGRFGESILAAPKFKGFNALVWLFPFIAVLVGLGLVFSYLQRQRTVQLADSVPGSQVKDDDRVDAALESQLERELAERQS